MKKEQFILTRLGTLAIIGFLPSIGKIFVTSGIIYMLGIFSKFSYCALFSIAIFAQENFNFINIMQDNEIPVRLIAFIQCSSIFSNTLVILLSDSLHPLYTHQVPF